ncbi:hypothetical protein F4802DRAFT_569079 [Xylaria palmicola]|nr:hypothetical protein F4802DRAFT_569079 [Xylaria palmicola]
MQWTMYKVLSWRLSSASAAAASGANPGGHGTLSYQGSGSGVSNTEKRKQQNKRKPLSCRRPDSDVSSWYTHYRARTDLV